MAASIPHEPLLEARNITKSFRRRDGSTLNAVDSVSLTINTGETVALVGETGSGKSTLARVALGLTAPDEGEILYKGTPLHHLSPADRHRFRLAVQPIFQDPGASFNPRRRVRDLMRQAFKQAAAPKETWTAATASVLQSVGLSVDPGFLQRFPHQLSGGQRQRLAVARALAMGPELIIADEPLSGADASIRGQILNLLDKLQREHGIAYLLITHDISMTRAFASRVAVLHQGTVVEEGLAQEVLRRPRHPYTQLLLAAAPSVGGEVDLTKFNTLAQREAAPAGCVFYARCPIAVTGCTALRPTLITVGPNQHRAACFALEEAQDSPAAGMVTADVEEQLRGR